MAYVKVSRSSNATAALRYGEHEKGVIRGGVDCPEDTETARRLFTADRIMWNKDSGVQAHVIIQSFDGRECSPEEANKIGQELARAVAPGHRAMVYTHQESQGGNTHNHIVICAVNQENGKKLDDHGFLWRARQQSNELTKERGLSVIHERTAALRYTQAERGLIDKGVQPWKDEIREVIDHAKQECRNVEDFKAYLQRHGIEINERGSRTEKGGKSWTYKHPDGGKVRGAKLGEEYTRSAVTESLSMEKSHETALEQVEQLQDDSSSTLEKALQMADKAGEKEQEKFAALELKDKAKEPDEWRHLSEMAKDDITHDLSTIDDYGIGR